MIGTNDQPHAYEHGPGSRCKVCDRFQGAAIHHAPRVRRSPFADPQILRPIDRGESHENDRQAWWMEDYFWGYRSHLPHPMMTSTGSEGRCDICGRSSTRDHEEPHQRITYEEWRAEQEPPVSEQPKPVFTNTGWLARMDRLANMPAVSTASRGEAETRASLVEELDRIQAAARASSLVQKIINGKDPMNLSITTERGQQADHRATVTSQGGTIGVFAEHQDQAGAVSRAVAAFMRANDIPEDSKTETASLWANGRVARTASDIRSLLDYAIDTSKYVQVDYTDVEGRETTRRFLPLRFSADGLAVEGRVAHSGSRGYRRLILSRVQAAEVTDA